MFEKVLIANRGAIACRVIRTLRRLGVASVAVHSDADRASLHVTQADEAVAIGPAPAADSYLRIDRILDAARATGAQAIHPGYGFLSENAAFAEACAEAGIAFVGPTPAQMRAFGLKHTARALAQAHGVPLLPGSGLLPDLATAHAECARIGYPVMLKSTGGGGGIGMRLVRAPAELDAAWASVARLAQASFKDAGMYVEKFVERARHVEVQLFGDGRGHVVALGERDCSLQRRHQKVIEETPAPNLPAATRAALLETSVRLGQAVGYRSAGTVEYVLDADSGAFFFLEVNTRLQVEHGVTEEVTGIDLVEWMLQAAAGELDLSGFVAQPRGAAIQVRLYAEDPAKQFQPSSGVLTAAAFPDHVRVETWVQPGVEVPPWYDPMIAKVIATGVDRDAALAKLRHTLADTRIAGIETNLDWLRQVCADPVVRDGRQTTGFLATFDGRPVGIEVLEPGVQTTVQDWPGRLGFWHVGVPPSGPMDALAHRLANRLVGNHEGGAALECTASGPVLRFRHATVVALCGADMQPTLDGMPLAMWTSHAVPAGATLALGAVRGPGLRTTLAVAGGFDVPEYLGARATFTLGQFGGHAGRTLRAGDVLPTRRGVDLPAPRSLPAALVPHYPARRWEVGVLYGPHGAPDFFTDDDIGQFFGTDWEVHYHSSRTGVRLIGPRPQWARRDGGEAGLHPSNLHDNAYAVGAIDFTGDMPVILGPDGPSCGGFVCPAVIADAELWKLGQLRPGDRVRFVRVEQGWAVAHAQAARQAVATLRVPARPRIPARSRPAPVLEQLDAARVGTEVVYRQSGDGWLLIEYGAPRIDLATRLRAHALKQRLERERIAGVIDLTPGIRSLQVHFDPARLPLERLLRLLIAMEHELPPVDTLEVPSRVVHLPLSWDDPATRLAIERYMKSVRPDAPWCPSNIEFIRRINGLDSIDDVQRIVFDAEYLVMALGDVYLGAPVATPVDPRHRLVTTKYNPARTWTPENAVGIGGAYLCVYGMEGPGGYQFVGRTVQMWNRWRTTPDFAAGTPWLLRFFDRIRFYPVTERELLALREDFPLGRWRVRTEEGSFRLADHRQFLDANAASIGAFEARRQAAFEAERERWRAAGQAEFVGEPDAVTGDAAEAVFELPAGARAVATSVAGNVWKLAVAEGDVVAVGTPLVIVESMKMEIPVTAPVAGRVTQLRCREGAAVAAGQTLVVLAP